jgi:4'-phosphopantetheinyl transferase
MITGIYYQSFKMHRSDYYHNMLTPSFHPSIPNSYTLSPYHIDIFFHRIHRDSPYYASHLSVDEKEKANQFMQPLHKRHYIIAHGLLRHYLAQYTLLAPSLLQFDTHPNGKPYITNAPDVSFNLSHSHEYIMFAITKHHALGMDIEYMKPRPFIGIAEKMFHPDEVHFLNKSNGYDFIYRFFYLWSRKEAFIKYTGEGLRFPTETMNNLPHQPKDTPHHIDFYSISFMPAILLSGSLCYHSETQHIDLYRIP